MFQHREATPSYDEAARLNDGGPARTRLRREHFGSMAHGAPSGDGRSSCINSAALGWPARLSCDNRKIPGPRHRERVGICSLRLGRPASANNNDELPNDFMFLPVSNLKDTETRLPCQTK